MALCILNRFHVLPIRDNSLLVRFHPATERFGALARSSSATVVGSAAQTAALGTAHPRQAWSRPYGGDSSRLSQKREHVVGLDFARAFPTFAMPGTQYKPGSKISSALIGQSSYPCFLGSYFPHQKNHLRM